MTANAEPLHAADTTPRRQLTMWHAMAVCVGMVIGAGIFESTPLAAENVTSPTLLLALWAFCGAMSLAGALCFAEMAAAFPDAGGDYFFLRKAYGRDVGFLFAWSRFAVIHTGSMALLAFALGDYVAEALQVGEHTSTGFAALAIVAIAAVNLLGIRFGAGTQVVLMAGVIGGLLAVIAAGVWVALGRAPQGGPLIAPGVQGPAIEIGAALVFIFLAYGGWSDAATLSAEMRDRERGMQRALITGMTLVTLLYLAVNWAFLRGLTSYGLAESPAPAADLMLLAFGRPGPVPDRAHRRPDLDHVDERDSDIGRAHDLCGRARYRLVVDVLERLERAPRHAFGGDPRNERARPRPRRLRSVYARRFCDDGRLLIARVLVVSDAERHSALHFAAPLSGGATAVSRAAVSVDTDRIHSK